MASYVLIAAAVGAAPMVGFAQEPPGEGSSRSDAHPLCPAVDAAEAEPGTAVSDEDAAEAGRLAENASRAAILGDRAGARRLLEQAIALDPDAADVAYRLARVLEDSGAIREAIVEFCRFLALDPGGAEADDVRRRLEEYAQELGWDWSVSVPDVTLPTPGPMDVPRTVSSPAVPTYSASGALFAGIVLPGMGHAYSGRPEQGALVFLTAAGSALAGILYRRTHVECVDIPDLEGCPSHLVLYERETRPYMIHGVVGAAAIGLLAAVHAALTVGEGMGETAGAVPIRLRGMAAHERDPTLILRPVVRQDSGAGLSAAIRLPVP